jgi:hypothetical protein
MAESWLGKVRLSNHTKLFMSAQEPDTLAANIHLDKKGQFIAFLG